MNLSVPKFVGDLSDADAAVLARYARRATRILEFGVGGSTQIFAQLAPNVTSIDTSQEWIKITRARVSKLGASNRVTFASYNAWSRGDHDQRYDLVFVDGDPSLRGKFILRAWPLLCTGGIVLAHDTRKIRYIEDVLIPLLSRFHNEIQVVRLNVKASRKQSSNITTIRKKADEPYENWHVVEGKPRWRYGAARVPRDFWNR